MPASLSNATVLITGADGFTGVYLRKRLEKAGVSVVALNADLRDKGAIVSQLQECTVDYAVHLAAISFVPNGSDLDVYAVNLFGTQNLLEALSETQKSLKKVIVASSANVYGRKQISHLDESECPEPVNHYGISKLAMEHMAVQFRDRFPVLITRPFNYTGIGQAEHFLVPKMVSSFIRRSESIELGNIDIARDFSDVRWIVEAYYELLRSPINEGVFNLCSAHAVSLRSILETLESLSAHTLRIETNPAFVRANEIAVLHGDNEKLFAALPDLMKPISIEETLLWMLQNPSESFHPSAV